MNIILRSPLISLLNLARFCQSNKKSLAIVSRNCLFQSYQDDRLRVNLEQNRTQQDEEILSNKVKLFSPQYLQNQSKFDQLSQAEVNILVTAYNSNPSTLQKFKIKQVSANYLKHLFSCDPQKIYERIDKNGQDVLKRLRILAPNQQIKKITEAEVKTIMEYFTTGVMLPGCFSVQKNIQQGKDKQQAFVFNPTFTTTTFIFNHILQSIYTCPLQLFTGRYGAGKTTSFILYCLLMDKVASYAIGEKDQKEVNRLVKERLLVSPMKPLYWSFQKEDIIKTAIQSILSQCPEFKEFDQEGYNDTVSSMKQKAYPQIVHLKKFYINRNISTLMIIDQINALASMYITAFRPHIDKKTFKQKQKLLENEQNKETIRLNKVRQIVHGAGKFVIYNSSNNIERSVFSKNTEYPFSMNIETHQRVFIKEFPYFGRINKPKCVKEITANILFETKLREVKVTAEQQEHITELILKSDQKYFISPLIINQIIHNMKNKSISLLDSIEQQIKLDKSRRFINNIMMGKKQLRNSFKKAIISLYDSFKKENFKNKNKFEISSLEVNSIIQSLGNHAINQIDQSELFDRNLFEFSSASTWKWIGPPGYFEKYCLFAIYQLYTNSQEEFLKDLNIEQSRSAFESQEKIKVFVELFHKIQDEKDRKNRFQEIQKKLQQQ